MMMMIVLLWIGPMTLNTLRQMSITTIMSQDLRISHRMVRRSLELNSL